MSHITIEGVRYHQEEFLDEALPLFAAQSPFHRQLAFFLKEWYSPSPLLILYTSGSTGKPKKITVHKEQMLQSAAITCDFLGLKEGSTALLCLPLEYIAGKMMVVRSLYAGLNLVIAEPSGHPLANISEQVDFTAMVPLQVYNSLQREEEKKRLTRIGRLIVGGGAIDPQLEEALNDFPNAIYSTYGMTETVSHIALRRINGAEANNYYTPLQDVGVTLSEEGTLVIVAPRVATGPVITNDIAEIRADSTFRILGRKDNVINTGGIKVQIEEMEESLRPYVKENFAITSLPHPKLGEAIVLIIEAATDYAAIQEAVKKVLPHYQQPRHILTVEAVPQTGSGKTDRVATKKLAMEKLLSPDSV